MSNRRHYKHVSQGSVGSFSLGNSHKTHYSRHLHLAAMLLEWWCWTALRSLTIHPYLAFSVTTPGKIRVSLPIFIPSYKCRKIRYVAKMLEPWNWVWHRLLIARTQSTVLTLFQRPKSSVPGQHTSAIFIYHCRGWEYRSSIVRKRRRRGVSEKVSLCYLQARNLSFSITPFQAIAWNTNIKVVNVVVLDPKRKHLMSCQRCFSNRRSGKLLLSNICHSVKIQKSPK